MSQATYSRSIECQRVVVTGIGLVTPLGTNVADSWQGILSGQSGVRAIEHFDVSNAPVKFASMVQGFDATDYMSAKEARKVDTFIQYGIAASLQALEDSGLTIDEQNAKRVGIAVGSGIGGLPVIQKNYDAYLNGGVRKVSPFFVPAAIVNMISGNLGVMLGAKGPNIAVTTACTTGLHNIGEAYRMIAMGDADAMIAGGAEMSTCEMGLSGFCAARALSTRNDAPQQASRPWDKDRDGFVLGEGAGVVMLESLASATARGAKIYGELIGYGLSCDAFHITAPPATGEGAALAMENAIKSANIDPTTVDYVNAHGTSTKVGDLAETNAIKQAFGEHAYQLAVSSTKSMIGHLLGAAGSVEAIFCLLAIRDQIAPPTINLDNPEEGCDLDYIPHKARHMPINVALTNSFGFGGTNGSLIFKKFE